MGSELRDQAEYVQFLDELKARIRIAQTRAALRINKELLLLYLDIGKRIVEKQEELGWGKSVVEQLALDLRHAFPDVTGFSSRNLWHMRTFYVAYKDDPILQQLVAEIPWGHNLAILAKVKEHAQRLWYVQQTIQNGWSRNVLVHQIESDLYSRQVAAVKTTNFPDTLPSPQSELVEQMIKDPYIFDFITIARDAKERDLEKALLEKLTEFLLELGVGFAFMGNQYHLEVAERDFYIDLLFYHHRLRCLVAVDLKLSEFMPEYAGKMNFYLSALDDLVRQPEDQPSVGIILCKSKQGFIAEYSLRDMTKPIGISEYRLTPTLPERLRRHLPNPQQFAGVLKAVETELENEPGKKKGGERS